MVSRALHKLVHIRSVLTLLDGYAEAHLAKIETKSAHHEWIDEAESKYELFWRVVDLSGVWHTRYALASSSYLGTLRSDNLDSEHVAKGPFPFKVF